IEGGAVFKYPNSPGANPATAYIKLNTSPICKTSSYRPAIFTAADDDTIGEVVTTQIWASHTGNPQGKYYANPALWVSYISSTLANMRFSYAQEGIRVEGSSAISSTISHAQLVNCIRGIVLTGDDGSSSGSGLGVTLNSSLMANVQYPFISLATPFQSQGGGNYDSTLPSASPVPVAVSVANLNTPPVIGLPTTPAPEFIKGGAATLIDPAATVTDPDSVSFDAAVLLAAVSGFASEDDRLAIRNQGTGANQISTSGSSVSYSGVNIGTFSGGVGFSPLLVQFNAAATLTSVQAVLRNLTYQNVLLAAQPGARTVRLVLTDGDGGTSPAATKTMNVV